MEQQFLFADLAINILGIQFELVYGEVWLSTLEIERDTGKKHRGILRDVEEEFNEELEDNEEIWLHSIVQRWRETRGGRSRYYLLGPDAALQLYARYDKNKRRRMVKAIGLLSKELENRMTKTEKETFVQNFLCKLGGPHCIVTQMDELLVCDKHGLI